jgi:hypothetical protein
MDKRFDKTNLKGRGWDRMDLIHLADDRGQWRTFVNTVKNLRVRQFFRKFLSSWTNDEFSGRIQLHEVN